MVGQPHCDDEVSFLNYVQPCKEEVPRMMATLDLPQNLHARAAIMQLWQDDHAEYQHEAQPGIDNLPPTKSNVRPSCLDAGCCICGDNNIFGFRQWLMRGMSDCVNGCAVASKLIGCSIVVRLSRSKKIDDPMLAAIRLGVADGVEDTFLFVGLMYLSPKRPTFRELAWPGCHIDARGLLHLQCTDVYWNLYEFCSSVREHLATEHVLNVYELYESDEPLLALDARDVRLRVLCPAYPKIFGRKTVSAERASAALDILDALPDCVSDAESSDHGDGSDGGGDEVGDGSDDSGCVDVMTASSDCTSNRDSDSSVGSNINEEDRESEDAISDSSSDSMVGLPVGAHHDHAAPVAVAPKIPAEITVVLPWGTLKYYLAREEIVAECNQHSKAGGVGEKRVICRTTRTTATSLNPGRAGQGRPIGLLVAWLMASTQPDIACMTAIQHNRHRPMPNYIDRVNAREYLRMCGLPNATLFFIDGIERCPRGHEDEPETIP
jgi:hypothetical protein